MSSSLLSGEEDRCLHVGLPVAAFLEMLTKSVTMRERGVGGQPHKTPHFNSRHRYTSTPGMTFPRGAWVRLNRLCTGVGRFRSCLYKWGMAFSAACECGAEEQTVDHVILQCSIHRPPTDCTA